MRKKLLVLIATLCMIFSLVGCSSEGLSLMKEFEKVGVWEATEQIGTMAFAIVIGGEKVKLSFDYTAYTVADTLQMEMILTPKSLENSGITVSLTEGKFKVSPIRVYLDGSKAYISTTYIKNIFAILGEDLSQAEVGMDLSKEYIEFDLASIYAEMGIDIEELAASNQQYTKDFYNQLIASNITCPIQQEGRKYVIKLTSDQLVQVGAEIFAQSIEMQKDLLLNEYVAMGLTEEEIAMAMEEVNALTSPEVLDGLKQTLKGSNAKVVFTFDEGKQISEYLLTMYINQGGESAMITFYMKDIAKKEKVMTINMPTNVTVYTMEDFVDEAETIDSEVAYIS